MSTHANCWYDRSPGDVRRWRCSDGSWGEYVVPPASAADPALTHRLPDGTLVTAQDHDLAASNRILRVHLDGRRARVPVDLLRVGDWLAEEGLRDLHGQPTYAQVSKVGVTGGDADDELGVDLPGRDWADAWSLTLVWTALRYYPTREYRERTSAWVLLLPEDERWAGFAADERARVSAIRRTLLYCGQLDDGTLVQVADL